MQWLEQTAREIASQHTAEEMRRLLSHLRFLHREKELKRNPHRTRFAEPRPIVRMTVGLKGEHV